MRREDIKNLITGITDDQLDKIMGINGRDIENAKKDLDSYKTQVETLTGQIKERDTQLGELKKAVKDNEALTAKITELETANTQAKESYENQIVEMSKANAIENALRDAKAKNVKAVKALLDTTKIEYKDSKLLGLDDQIKALSESEDTKFLFGEATTSTTPTGTKPSTPPDTSAPKGQISFADAVAKAMNLKG